jgi:hypothetical protein
MRGAQNRRLAPGEVVVTITPLVSVGRLFRDGARYGEPFSDTFVITHDSPDTVTISAARAALSRPVLRQIGAQLLASGVRVIRCFRAAGHRVPGGTLVERGDHFDEWRIDLDKVMQREAACS